MKTGIAFPDYIQTEKPKRHSNHNFFSKNYTIRPYLMPLLLFIVVAILLGRLFFLQAIRGIYYRYLADSNRIRTIIVNAPRGIIFDRNGIPLVFNIPGFRQTPPAGGGKTRIIDNTEALSLIAQGKKDLEVDSLRSYPYKEILAHTLGYIGQVSEDELNKPKFKDYKAGEMVGKIGIEEKYERNLRGINGRRLVEIDNVGKIIRKLGQTDPIPGQNITLTIDIELQKAVYSAMEGVKKGAAIVSSQRGEILALVSKPSFDPNLFTLSKSYTVQPNSPYRSVEEVLKDEENQPLVNRAISGEYPPGSTFKLIVAAAGLEENMDFEHFRVEDTGILKIREFSFSNWYFTKYGKTEGLVDLIKAIKRSNDIFFYKASEKIGVDKISTFAKRFGLGGSLGIDLGGEAKGILPTTSWKKKVIGEPWFLGDTYHFGIGQGYVLATPLQVNVWTSAIANGGILYKPHIFKNPKSQIPNPKFLSDKTVSLIRQGMVESCSPGGVAWPLFEFRVKNSELRIDGKNFLEVKEGSISAQLKDQREIVIACKTGTAEHGGKETKPHAWITLFAPAYDPQIVVTVLAEESGEGSNIAAPIAKKILEEWFGRY